MATYTARVLASLNIVLIYEMMSKSWSCEALLTSVQLMMVFLDGNCFNFLSGNDHRLY